MATLYHAQANMRGHNEQRDEVRNLPDRSLSAEDARTWIRDMAAPFWLRFGIDEVNGGFFDVLDGSTGANCVDYKRLRTTCRQIYVFAVMAKLGIEEASDAVQHGLRFLCGPLRHSDGGFHDQVDLLGRSGSEVRPLYDLAFALFAMAKAADFADTDLCRSEALSLLGFIRQMMSHAAGGFAEALPPVLPRRQNPHMHLLEACLEWAKRDGDPQFFQLAQELLDLAGDRFFSSNDGALLEYFEDNLSRIEDPDLLVFEPGHHFEWLWLLHRARQLGLAVPPIDDMLATTAMLRGFHPESGLPYGQIRTDGHVRISTCRIWQICEWARAEALEVQDVAASGISASGQLRRFLNGSVPGTWFESADPESGKLMPGPLPATSLYHILGALTAIAGAGHD